MLRNLKFLVVLAILASLQEIVSSQHQQGKYNIEYSTHQIVNPGVYRAASSCEDRSCYPATGDLLIGRENNLLASSTCGLRGRERFCIVSHLQERKKCFSCDSTVPSYNYNHKVENLITRRGEQLQRKKTWWQAENGVEKVFIQLDLEAEFHFTHLIITFKTFRPSAMLIERSFDFGETWKVYRYFAHDCQESFPGIPTGVPKNITDVICESRYSSVQPSTEGEVIFRVLPPNLPINDPYSEEVQNLLKMTNLRINFTRLHTLGDDLLDNRKEIKEKYYYAIYEMVVRGSCSCYGHASRCQPLPGIDVNRDDMVHGMCLCTHNTKGLNCEQCQDFYNDLPWKPAIGQQKNACKQCNCHGHSRRCHFDAAVYEATAWVSGGVCDECEDNTMGTNCEQCKNFFYHDPSKNISHPDACVACDCDPRGSLDDGVCDSRSNFESGLDAGRCHCKHNIEGRRCDRCKSGFWNFQAANPEGCEACSCDTQGTVNNEGCNPYTGECICKRYVTGRNCAQCLPDFYGMSEDRDGCKACDCDPGGSVGSSCDIYTGQCKCRSWVTGRRCDQPHQGYFAAYLDYFVFEAENAGGNENTQIIKRVPHSDRDTTWTGDGFMQVLEGSTLDFEITNIKTSMEYDIVIRYEPKLSGRWEDVRVTVERQGHVDRDGRCTNAVPSDDHKKISLHQDHRSEVVYPPACLEAGKTYKIRFEFKRYDSQVDTPTASILIDSITLIPRVDGLPFFQDSTANEYKRQEFERFRCGHLFNNVVKPNIPETCKKHLTSIGFYVYGGGIECECDLTGSVSTICDPLGGQCQCKTNVVNRRCDKCSLGTYGFGPVGCVHCDCSNIGALDNFCDASSGQCECRTKAFGRQCDECQPGYWNYPTCQRCECNEHADTCDPRTGYCIDCRDYTAGAACDECEVGFYGDPRYGVDIPCRPCPCPGTASDHSFATTCRLDPYSQNVKCNCKEGYSGDRCDICDNNYYGNPDIKGGSCRECNCNKNMDLTRQGNCDAKTGECKQCLFNTEGFYCDKCRPGFYGDAINQLCSQCACNELGTNIGHGYCDPVTGQCPCYENVVGRACDLCKPNHWMLASGSGCVPCDCDPYGSLSDQCNIYYGQCDCRPNFGGSRCNECQTNHWGDPNTHCRPCDCNGHGSDDLQCHRNNGTCVCKKGIGGDKCDQCARGYTGHFPYCEPCGECFDNWDIIIAQLRAETARLIDEAKNIKQSGATGAYTDQFTEMERKLEQVREILGNANVTNADIDDLQQIVDKLRQNLTEASNELESIEREVESTNTRIGDASLNLNEFRRRIGNLQMDAADLKNNATLLQEANVEGALNITREALKRSREAQGKVDGTTHKLDDSERQRGRTEQLIQRAQSSYNRTIGQNRASLDRMSDRIRDLESEIPSLNNKVCDGFGNPCDTKCGGAGCDKCGGYGCNEGAVTKAEDALDLAKEADKLLATKEKSVNELLENTREARGEADTAYKDAKEAFDRVSRAKNSSEGAKNTVEALLEQINSFLIPYKANPADIRKLAQDTLKEFISLKPDQIRDLARQINATVANLTNIDAILRATNSDVDKANRLKERADRAKDDADNILKTAQDVKDALDDAKTAQDAAEEAIKNANKDINKAEVDLTQADSETVAAKDVADKSANEIKELQAKLEGLNVKYVKNELDMKQAMKVALGAKDQADTADRDASELEFKYKKAERDLDGKANDSGVAKDRAEKLKNRAEKLAQDALSKLGELKEMENEFNDYEIKLKDYTEELNQLNGQMSDHLQDIEAKLNWHQTCGDY